MNTITAKYYDAPQKFTATYNFASGEENDLFNPKFKAIRKTNCTLKIDDVEVAPEKPEDK